MNKAIAGVVHGRTIVLSEDPGVPDGQQVQVVVSPTEPGHRWGEGILRSAGGWTEWPEMDDVMEAIHQERKRERRLPAPE